MEKKENKILIISGGQSEASFANSMIKKEHYSIIIAADSGLVLANQLGLSLDFIVGDFDSVPEEILRIYQEKSTPIETFPKEKDKTDTQIAIELALMHNPTKLDIVGATGSRLDHTFANLHLLLLPMQLNIDATIINPNNKMYLKRESFQISKKEQFGEFVSFLPFSEKVTGLTLQGFKYPLDRVILSAGSSLGISNEIIVEVARVEFDNGILLVMETRD